MGTGKCLDALATAIIILGFHGRPDLIGTDARGAQFGLSTRSRTALSVAVGGWRGTQANREKADYQEDLFQYLIMADIGYIGPDVGRQVPWCMNCPAV